MFEEIVPNFACQIVSGVKKIWSCYTALKKPVLVKLPVKDQLYYHQAIMAWAVSPLNILHPNLIITYEHASYQKNNSEYSQKLNIDPSFQNSLQTSNFFLITALLSFGTT